VNPDPPHFVWINPDTFTMGSPSTDQDRNSDEGPQSEPVFAAFASCMIKRNQPHFLFVSRPFRQHLAVVEQFHPRIPAQCATPPGLHDGEALLFRVVDRDGTIGDNAGDENSWHRAIHFDQANFLSGHGGPDQRPFLAGLDVGHAAQPQTGPTRPRVRNTAKQPQNMLPSRRRPRIFVGNEPDAKAILPNRREP